MKINCIIIDDEPLARKGLKEYISDVDYLELIGEFDNPLKAGQVIENGQVQLIFLDIQMPKISGLEFLRSMKDPPPVIFTTAYPQHAVDGFELNALDYLLKPISFPRFLASVNKAREYYLVRNQEFTSGTPSANRPDYFFIKAENKLVKIDYDEILYVEALQNYVNIHTNERKYLTYLTFKSIEEYLPSDQFIKTHKSYIVSASKIDSIEGNDIRIGVNHIPISRNLKDEVMERLLKGKFLKR